MFTRDTRYEIVLERFARGPVHVHSDDLIFAQARANIANATVAHHANHKSETEYHVISHEAHYGIGFSLTAIPGNISFGRRHARAHPFVIRVHVSKVNYGAEIPREH